MVWSGSRTRDRQSWSLLLYPTELSIGVPESNRRPAAEPLLSLTELTPSCRNTAFRSPAYATATPRAPDGRETRAAGDRSIDASHCRLSPTGNPRAHAFPAAARIEHRDAALARLMAEFRAATTRARTSLSGRSRWMLRNVGEERVSETVRAAKIRACVRGSPLRTRKRKRPRKRLPRAFAFLGDRGDRSPERRSVLVGDGVAPRLRPIVRLPAGVRIAQEARRCEAAVVAKGGRHRNGSKQGVFDAVVRRWARTLHASFAVCKHF